nr:UBX domain-containing protein 11-like isoform X3 [Manis javanica]
MSSPLASLGKTRRVPLQSEPVNSGRQGIKIYRDEDEVDVLNDGHGLEEKISIPSCNSGIGAPASRQAASTQFAVPSVADHPSSGPPHDPSPWWLPASHAPSSQLTFPGPAFPPSSSV